MVTRTNCRRGVRCPIICRVGRWPMMTACTCPQRGDALRRLDEDVTEVLDYLPAPFPVIRHVRPKIPLPDLREHQPGTRAGPADPSRARLAGAPRPRAR